MNNSGNWMGRTMRLCVIFTLGACLPLMPINMTLGDVIAQQSAAPKGVPIGAQRPASLVGQLVSYGAVMINNRRAPTGSTVFNNSLIKVPCEPGNSAIIRIGTAGVIELKSGAQLQLTFSAGQIGGDLREGSIRVRTQHT
jgi:hypothetical protein